MSDILLRELSNDDIDWLVRSGQRQQLTKAEVLLSPGQALDCLYLMLEGSLALYPSETFSGISSETSSGNSLKETYQEIARRSRGEILGAGWLFNTKPVVSAVATGDVMLLTVPKASLVNKLRQDVSFAAHFYRALALMMSQQIRRLFEHSDLLQYQSGQMVKEALFVFGELQDSDIDWMMSAGRVERLAAEKILLHMGRPVDALYTLLDGQLAISTTENPCDPLANCSHGLTEHGATHPYNPIAYLSRGGLPGITSFLDFQPLPVRFHAVRESVLLAIPRQQVLIKLQEDLGFAARFYRVMATQLSHLLTAISVMGNGIDRTVTDRNITDRNITDPRALTLQLEDELDLEELQIVSQGATKFDWMLKYLGVGS